MSGNNQRLVLVALDLAEPQQEQVLTCFSTWAENDLLGHVRVVDLSTSEDAWPTLKPEERGVFTIESAFDERAWQEVVVISPRSRALGGVSEDRIAAEVRLKERVLLAYPVSSATKSYFYTLTVLPDGGTFDNSQLPFGFTVNFLHESTNFVDKMLALKPIGPDIDTTVAFTALVCAGAFECQGTIPLEDVHDTVITDDRPTRMVRALGRAASAGYFLDTGIRRILSPESGFSIASAPNLKVVDENAALLSRFSSELITVANFEYQYITFEKPAHIRPTGFFGAIRVFFSGFGGYLVKAVKRTVHEELRERARPFIDAFQDVLFGPNSTIVIAGSHLDTPEEIVSELKRRLNQVKEIKEIESMASVLVPNKQSWEILVDSCIGLLDGSPMPPGMESLDQAGVRTVFALPAVVAPPPSIADFYINVASLDRLSLPKTFTKVDLLDSRAVDTLRSSLEKSRIKDLFTTSAPTPEPDEDPDILVGSWVTAVKAKSPTPDRADPADSLPIESPSEILTRLEDSLRVMNRDYADSVLMKVAQSINEGLEIAASENHFEEIQKRAMVDNDRPKQKSAFMKWAFGSIAGLGLLFLMKALLAAVFTIGVIVVFVIWLFGFALALMRKIVSLAIRIRKEEFARNAEWTELSALIARTIRSITETSRLSTMREQFSDWSRVVREVVHSPFGRLSDVEGSLDSLLEIPRPPQFATAKLLQSNEQALQTQKEIWGSVMYLGYLDGMYKSIKSRWIENYSAHISEGFLAPESDTGTRRQIAALNNDRRVLNPRSDFAESVCAKELREEYTVKVMDSVTKRFETRLISDVFSRTETRIGGTQAFDHFKPRDFLYSSIVGRDESVGINFASKNFKPESGKMVANVERRLSSKLDETLGAFPFGLGRPMIFMTWAMDVGYRVDLSQMTGYAEERRESPTGPGDDSMRRA